MLSALLEAECAQSPNQMHPQVTKLLPLLSCFTDLDSESCVSVSGRGEEERNLGFISVFLSMFIVSRLM